MSDKNRFTTAPKVTLMLTKLDRHLIIIKRAAEGEACAVEVLSIADDRTARSEGRFVTASIDVARLHVPPGALRVVSTPGGAIADEAWLYAASTATAEEGGAL